MLERIKYLERVSDKLERAAVYVSAALLVSPFIEKLTGIAATALVPLSIYRVRKGSAPNVIEY